jgi:DNA-binding response OmpR family regulator
MRLAILLIDACESQFVIASPNRHDSFAAPEEVASAISIVKTYRLVVLDTEVDTDNSVKVIKKIRCQTPKTTILATTEHSDLGTRIQILDAGADDVLVKPFPLAELAAHCRALLRRAGNSVQDAQLKAGNILLNASTSEVVINGKRVHLTKREVNLLTQLMRRYDHIVPKPHLLDSLFAFSDQASANAVEAIVSRLRRTLAASRANVTILTEHGIGYVLTGLMMN